MAWNNHIPESDIDLQGDLRVAKIALDTSPHADEHVCMRALGEPVGKALDPEVLQEFIERSERFLCLCEKALMYRSREVFNISFHYKSASR